MGANAFFIVSAALFLISQTNAEECYPTFVDCYCDKNFEPVVQIPINTALTVDDETGRSYCLADTYAPDVCSERNCTIIPNENYLTLFGNKNAEISGKETSNAETGEGPNFKFFDGFMQNLITRAKRFISGKKFMVKKEIPKGPQEIVLFPGSFHQKKQKRSFEPCAISSLSNSALSCWKWPNWITCNQDCAFGHGITNGTQTIKKIVNLNCRMSENVWRPHPIKDCQPYFNCQAHLKSPGDLVCYQGYAKPSVCEIKCWDYDDFPETKLANYTCGSSFNLPHCAALDDTVQLIAPPPESKAQRKLQARRKTKTSRKNKRPNKTKTTSMPSISRNRTL